MKLSRRATMKKSMFVLAGYLGFASLGEKAKATNKETTERDTLNQFLDEGGQLVIKRQSCGNIVAIEATIGNQKYHGGIRFDTSDKLLKDWDSIVKAALAALKRKKTRLQKTRKVKGD